MAKLRRQTLTTLDGIGERPAASPVRHSVDVCWKHAKRFSTSSLTSKRGSFKMLADFNCFESLNITPAQATATQDLPTPYFDNHDDMYHSKKDAVIGQTEIFEEKALPETPYHIFTRQKKKQIVYIVSLGGLFSPLSSNIYFPALDQISRNIGVSISLVSLTVTVYMIVQGLAPSFWGPLSDTKGRRIVFISTFIVYLFSNIGLAFSNDIISLMIFRGVQAAGSAATISIGAGVISDVTTASERGSLIGIFGGIRMMGQSIGPVFGGLISQYLGFHAIFWFLFGLGAAAILIIILLLPETLRSIAGDGTVRLTGIHRPLLYSPPGEDVATILKDQPKRKLTFSSVFSPMRFLFEKDVFVSLFFGSIIYTVWSMVTSTSSALFTEYFELNTLEIGLAFLPNGAGCVSGSILTGYIMDYDYQRTVAEYNLSKGNASDMKINKKELDDFPMEKSRLRNSWWMVIIFLATTAAYGFSLRIDNLAPALILQFFIAYTATSIFSLNSALVIDLYPGASASATAVNNLIRCSIGALGVAFAQPIIEAMGAGFTFLMLAGVTAALSPLLFVSWRWGPGWRMERAKRLAGRAEEKSGGV